MESSCVEDTVTISFEIKAFLETLRLDSLRKRVHPLFSHGKKQIKKLMDPWRRDLALSYNVSFVEHLLLAMAQRKIVNDNILICNHTFSRPDLRVERWYSWPLDELTRMILNYLHACAQTNISVYLDSNRQLIWSTAYSKMHRFGRKIIIQ